MTFAKLLPMAFVMVAGPQVLSAVFLATVEDWRRCSAAFVLGAALSISLIVTAAFLLGGGVSDTGSGNDAMYVGILLLLLFAMVHAYVTREQTEPPAWMGRLAGATPKFAFGLGFLLLGVFPTDILTSVSVGSYVAAQGDSLWHAVPFIALTLLILGLPALALLAFGERGEALLPKARDWMTTNAWIVNEVVLSFFVLIVISDLVG